MHRQLLCEQKSFDLQQSIHYDAPTTSAINFNWWCEYLWHIYTHFADSQKFTNTCYSVRFVIKALGSREQSRVLGEAGSEQPPDQLESLGEHCKLHQWGRGWTPGRQEPLGHFIAQKTHVNVWYITSILPKPTLRPLFLVTNEEGRPQPVEVKPPTPPANQTLTCYHVKNMKNIKPQYTHTYNCFNWKFWRFFRVSWPLSGFQGYLCRLLEWYFYVYWCHFSRPTNTQSAETNIKPPFPFPVRARACLAPQAETAGGSIGHPQKEFS